MKAYIESCILCFVDKGHLIDTEIFDHIPHTSKNLNLPDTLIFDLQNDKSPKIGIAVIVDFQSMSL